MSIKLNAKTTGLVLLCLIAALLVALPVAAQSDDEQELVVVEGLFTIAADGTITVDDYVIAPANAFLPPDVSEGDAVLITGYLLPDGLTVQALSIEIEQDAPTGDSDGTSPTSDETDNLTDTTASGNTGGQGNSGHGNGLGNGGHGNGQGNGRGNGQGNDQGNGRGNGQGNDQGNGREHGFYCQNTGTQHPAATRLAAEFDVPYSEVITLFCEGRRGFGQIVKAYRLSEASGLSVAAIFALRDEGMGWGRIMRDLGIHPGDIMGNRNHHGNANGNGNGRGNGNG